MMYRLTFLQLVIGCGFLLAASQWAQAQQSAYYGLCYQFHEFRRCFPEGQVPQDQDCPTPDNGCMIGMLCEGMHIEYTKGNPSIRKVEAGWYEGNPAIETRKEVCQREWQCRCELDLYLGAAICMKTPYRSPYNYWWIWDIRVDPQIDCDDLP